MLEVGRNFQEKLNYMYLKWQPKYHVTKDCTVTLGANNQ